MHDDADSALATTPVGGGDERLRPGSRLGRFTILRLLGAGGMGAVYEARDPQLDRSVAIKVLPGRGSDDLRRRLVREAQALAQLQHPNVVAVHEVGVADGRVFIAMELIDGVTLDRHLKDTPHGWRDVVDLYVLAGHGLVAAHAKGLIHRDFKPGNVLVSVDGRVRVTDFGLARLSQAGSAGDGGSSSGDAASGALDPADIANATTAAGDSATEVAPATPTPPLESDQALLATPLTDAGALLGTRRYMAPEQFQAKPATAQSDQFSFCVALWESLFGQHPFAAGKELGGLAATVAGARILPPPRGAAPRRLVQLLTRGLAADPALRHPSMQVLVDALASLPLRRRRLTIAAAGLAIAATAVVASVAITGTGRVDCTRAGRDLDDLWTAATRASITTRFAGLRPYGADTATRVGAALDTWTRRWRDTRIDACRATHDRGEQSADLLDRRSACLDRGRMAMSTLVTAFGSADGDAVDRAIEAANALPPPDDCSAAQIAGQGSTRLHPQSIVVEQYLQAAQTRWNLGQWDAASKLGAAAIAQANTLHDDILKARAMVAHARYALLKSPGEARTELERALELAGQNQDRITQAECASTLLEEAARAYDTARVAALLPVARAAVAASGSVEQARRLPRVELLAVRSTSGTAAMRGVCKHMEDAGAPAFELVECECRAAQDVPTDAIRLCQASVALTEKQYGSAHPALGPALQQLADAYNHKGDYQASLALQDRRVQIVQDSLGRDSELYAQGLSQRAITLEKLGRLTEAEHDYDTSLSVISRLSAPPSLDLVRSHVYLGRVLHKQHRDDEAVQQVQVGLQLADKVLGPDHRELPPLLLTAGRVLAESGHRSDAQIAYQNGEDLSRRLFGDAHQLTLALAAMQAQLAIADGHPEMAIGPARRVFDFMRGAPGVEPINVANANAMLGEAIFLSGDHAEGRRLLLEARGRFVALGPVGAAGVKEIDQKLATGYR